MSALVSLYLCLHSYLSFSVWLSLSISLTLPSCISVYLSFFNPCHFFNLFSLCGSLPLMFLFLPRCLSFFLSLCPTPVCLDISPSLFFHLPSLSLTPFSFYLSLCLSLSLPFLFLSFFLSLSVSLSLSTTPVYLSLSHSCHSIFLSLFHPFLSFPLSFTIPVSLCIILSLRSLSFLIISHKFCGFCLVVNYLIN